MNKIVKGFLLMLAVIFTALQGGNVVWAATIITAVCVGIGYFVKNIWFSSVSEDGVFDWRDIASALILAVVAAVSESIGQIVVGGIIEWGEMVKIIVAALFTYFSTTFFSGAKRY